MADATSPNHALVTTLACAVKDANPAGAAWLAKQLAGRVSDGSALATAFSWAVRKVGHGRVELEIPSLRTPKAGWDATTAARLALLLTFADSHTRQEEQALLSDLYYRGDTGEKCAVLRCLPLLATPEPYLLVATDGVRSHVQPVFEAITCENPYPASNFDEAAFNQMVMKAYFTSVPVHRIVGLAERKNAELGRMAADFAAERHAAGRPIPSDLRLVTTLP